MINYALAFNILCTLYLGFDILKALLLHDLALLQTVIVPFGFNIGIMICLLASKEK